MIQELSLFFPAYNEEAVLADTVTKAIAVLQKLSLRQFEVIIVNDGSRDNTAAIADQLASKYPFVKVVHHQENRGYGGALKSGFAASRYEWIAFSDSDGQFDFSEIQNFLPYTDQYDAIIGYRINRQDHLVRKLNAQLWGLAMKKILNIKVKDLDCAFKLLRSSTIKSIGPLQSNGAFISAELLARLQNHGARTIEVGVTHYPRSIGKQTGANIQVIRKAFSEMWHLRKALAERPQNPNDKN